MLNPECEELDRSKFDTTKIIVRNQVPSALLQSISSKKISSDSKTSPAPEMTDLGQPGASLLDCVLDELVCNEKQVTTRSPECLVMMSERQLGDALIRNDNFARMSSLSVQPMMSVRAPKPTFQFT